MRQESILSGSRQSQLKDDATVMAENSIRLLSRKQALSSDKNNPFEKKRFLEIQEGEEAHLIVPLHAIQHNFTQFVCVCVCVCVYVCVCVHKESEYAQNSRSRFKMRGTILDDLSAQRNI